MSMPLDALEAEALQLSPAQRVALADCLLASVAGAEGLDAVWAAEVMQRLAAIESGQGRLVPAEVAIERARQALR